MTDWHDGVLCFNLIQKEREVHYWFPMSSRDPAGASPGDLQQTGGAVSAGRAN